MFICFFTNFNEVSLSLCRSPNVYNFVNETSPISRILVVTGNAIAPTRWSGASTGNAIAPCVKLLSLMQPDAQGSVRMKQPLGPNRERELMMQPLCGLLGGPLCGVSPPSPTSKGIRLFRPLCYHRVFKFLTHEIANHYGNMESFLYSPSYSRSS